MRVELMHASTARVAISRVRVVDYEVETRLEGLKGDRAAFRQMCMARNRSGVSGVLRLNESG